MAALRRTCAHLRGRAWGEVRLIVRWQPGGCHFPWCAWDERAGSAIRRRHAPRRRRRAGRLSWGRQPGKWRGEPSPRLNATGRPGNTPRPDRRHPGCGLL